MSSWAEIERQVEQRSKERCEYCRMHQSLQGASFHIEHIQPRSQGGSSLLENLAWACPGCNLQKSNRTKVIDSQTGESVSLFHPRLDNWQDHFRWKDYHLVGITSIGRATVAALDLNHARRLRIRQAEEFFELFPPEESS